MGDASERTEVLRWLFGMAGGHVGVSPPVCCRRFRLGIAHPCFSFVFSLVVTRTLSHC